MKRIVFTVAGQRVSWKRLTGINHPRTQDPAELRDAARLAQDVDDRIETFHIVEDACTEGGR